MKILFLIQSLARGGAELFYGYGKYAFLYRHRHVYRLPAGLMLALRGLDALLRRNRSWNSASRLLRGDRAWRFVSLKNSGLGELFDGLPGRVAWQNSDFAPERRDILYQVRDFDIGVTLPGSYIPSVDRGSMRASLEVRTPFLSRALVECIAAFDQRSFLAFGQKDVLRRLLHRYVPPDISSDKKQGFVFPAARYLVQCQDRTPVIEGVPPTIAQEIWTHRSDQRYQQLAIRLGVLESLYAKGDGRGELALTGTD